MSVVQAAGAAFRDRDFANLFQEFARLTGLDGLLAQPSSLNRFGSPPGTTYTVKAGDTLSAIARQHGTTWQTLARVNGLRHPDHIAIGQTLRLPANHATVHVATRGDTLWGIAQANGSTVAAVARANGIKNPETHILHPGDAIRLPGTDQVAIDRAKPRPVSRPNPADGIAPATRPSANATPNAGQPGAIDLRAFLDSARGSQSPAAIVIGNAEGTRTPSGGTTGNYAGHIDPGNGKGNRGSFSYQRGAGLTPAQADQAQLANLSGQIPAYEAAVRRAGLDPNNPTLATAYFDLFNQSQSAAARFLNQVGTLRATGISNQSVTDLRFHSFVNSATGQRFTYTDSHGRQQTAGGGFANIARDRIGRAPSEAEVQNVIRNDQARRQNAMVRAMQAQGIGSGTTNAPVATSPNTTVPQTSSVPSSGQAPRFGHNSGIDLAPAVVAKANRLYDNVRAATGYGIHVTSGRRPPARQADAMYDNYARGTAPTYSNRRAEAEIRNAYDAGRQNGWSKAQTVAAMTSVIQHQVDNGTYISNHMKSGSIDIRTPSQSVLNAIRNDPNVRRVGVESNHIHIDFK